MEEEKENPRGRQTRVSSLPDSAPSVVTRMTAGRYSPCPPIAAEPLPQRFRRMILQAPFAQASEASRNNGQATDGLRTSIKNLFTLAGEPNRCQGTYYGHWGRSYW